MNNIGFLLFNARKSNSLTLKEVSNKSGIDFTLISKFEKRERIPSIQHLETLSNIYRIDLDKLIIASYSDKVYEQIKHFDFASDILKVAEKKIDYNKTR